MSIRLCLSRCVFNTKNVNGLLKFSSSGSTVVKGCKGRGEMKIFLGRRCWTSFYCARVLVSETNEKSCVGHSWHVVCVDGYRVFSQRASRRKKGGLTDADSWHLSSVPYPRISYLSPMINVRVRINLLYWWIYYQNSECTGCKVWAPRNDYIE